MLFLEDKIYLRGSVEYQIRINGGEIQGIVGIRLLEACGNYIDEVGLHKPDQTDVSRFWNASNIPPKDISCRFY